LQNSSNLLAGEFAGGAVSFCWESGVAPPVWGGAAPPCGVLGFDWVVVCAGVTAVAVVVDVEVSVVSVLVVLTTVGVDFSPGTVSVGAVSGSGWAALSLPPPPHAERNGTAAVIRAAARSRWRFTG